MEVGSLVACLALAPTRLGRLLSPFFALRWRKACRGGFAASTSNRAQCPLFYGRQFLHKKILMLVGKHINAYLLDILLDFIIDKVEYRLELSAPLGCL
jgi:hypothetical protein